jgi:hypothetical protein
MLVDNDVIENVVAIVTARILEDISTLVASEPLLYYLLQVQQYNPLTQKGLKILCHFRCSPWRMMSMHHRSPQAKFKIQRI